MPGIVLRKGEASLTNIRLTDPTVTSVYSFSLLVESGDRSRPPYNSNSADGNDVTNTVFIPAGDPAAPVRIVLFVEDTARPRRTYNYQGELSARVGSAAPSTSFNLFVEASCPPPRPVRAIDEIRHVLFVPPVVTAVVLFELMVSVLPRGPPLARQHEAPNYSFAPFSQSSFSLFVDAPARPGPRPAIGETIHALLVVPPSPAATPSTFFGLFVDAPARPTRPRVVAETVHVLRAQPAETPAALSTLFVDAPARSARQPVAGETYHALRAQPAETPASFFAFLVDSWLRPARLPVSAETIQVRRALPAETPATTAALFVDATARPTRQPVSAETFYVPLAQPAQTPATTASLFVESWSRPTRPLPVSGETFQVQAQPAPAALFALLVDQWSRPACPRTFAAETFYVPLAQPAQTPTSTTALFVESWPRPARPRVTAETGNVLQDLAGGGQPGAPARFFGLFVDAWRRSARPRVDAETIHVLQPPVEAPATFFGLVVDSLRPRPRPARLPVAAEAIHVLQAQPAETPAAFSNLLVVDAWSRPARPRPVEGETISVPLALAQPATTPATTADLLVEAWPRPARQLPVPADTIHPSRVRGLPQTWWLLATNTGDSNFGGLQSTAPSGNASSGWIVGTTPLTTPYSLLKFNTQQPASTFGATSQLTGAPTNATKDSWRTPSPQLGTFTDGNWPFTLAVRAVTTAGGQQGHLELRVWASPSPTAAGNVRELTSGAVAGSTTPAMVLTGVNYDCSVTWSAPALTLNYEYLFFQFQWVIDTVGTTSTDSQKFRISACSLLTTEFQTGVGNTPDDSFNWLVNAPWQSARKYGRGEISYAQPGELAPAPATFFDLLVDAPARPARLPIAAETINVLQAQAPSVVTPDSSFGMFVDAPPRPARPRPVSGETVHALRAAEPAAATPSALFALFVDAPPRPARPRVVAETGNVLQRQPSVFSVAASLAETGGVAASGTYILNLSAGISVSLDLQATLQPTYTIITLEAVHEATRNLNAIHEATWDLEATHEATRSLIGIAQPVIDLEAEHNDKRDLPATGGG